MARHGSERQPDIWDTILARVLAEVWASYRAARDRKHGLTRNS